MAYRLFDQNVCAWNITVGVDQYFCPFPEEEKILSAYWKKLESTFGYDSANFRKLVIRLNQDEQEMESERNVTFKSIAIGETLNGDALDMNFCYLVFEEIVYYPDETNDEIQVRFDALMHKVSLAIQPIIQNIKTCIGFEYDPAAKIVASANKDKTGMVVTFGLTFKKLMQTHYYEEQEKHGRMAC